MKAGISLGPVLTAMLVPALYSPVQAGAGESSSVPEVTSLMLLGLGLLVLGIFLMIRKKDDDD